MEARIAFAAKPSFSSRTHLFPVSKPSRFPLTSLKPEKLVRSKATSTLSCVGEESNRKFEKLPPSEWTHRFRSVPVDASEMDELRREIDTLKPIVKETLMSSQGTDWMKRRILMIYSMVSLGVAYHFEDEIEESLKAGFERIEELMDGEDDLYTISIIFWVFRTYGHHISSNVFQIFKGENGKFKECLSGDAKGLVALYEAAHLGTTTDYIMDEALSFASNHLKFLAADGTCPLHLSMHIQNSLRLSQHRNMEILVAVEYIPFYEKNEDHDKMLLKFAKLNFNLMQLHYLEELKIVTKWYTDLDLESNIPPYFRADIVNNHFYSVAMYFEPKFAQHRIRLTKFYTVIALIDDTFDRYASLPEAETLANSLERWAADDSMDTHPNYLKVVFKFIVDCLEEVEREMMPIGKPYCMKALREEINIYARSNLALAKWVAAGYMPSFEEYMKFGDIVTGQYVMLVCTLMGMEHFTNEEVFEWIKSKPKFVQTPASNGRLLNDIAGYEIDMSRGFETNAVNYYMEQQGVTKMEAKRDLRNLVAFGDKIMNEEFLKKSDIPNKIRKLLFRVNRTTNVAYNEGEGYTYQEGRATENTASLFVNRIQI